MSPLFAGAVASAYVATMVGLHRWNVRRLKAAGPMRALERLDFEALLEGMDRSEPARAALLEALAGGVAPPDVAARAEAMGFSGGQARWLERVAQARADPSAAFEALDREAPTTAAELYLKEHLRLIHRTHPLNLELSVFTAKRALAAGLDRFGDAPALYFVRAHASSLIGFNRAAIDDLARAVYYSHQAPFYVRAVLDMPFLEEARPALVFQCRQALASAEERS